MRPEKVRSSQTDRPITESGSFSRASNNADVLGHALILQGRYSPSPMGHSNRLNRSKIAGMRLRAAVHLLALSLLSVAPGLRAETGAEGWLRYAPLPPQLAQQFKLPRCIVTAGKSTVALTAARELARGLHSMLGRDLQVCSTTSGEDAFLLGTPLEIRQLLPTWKAPSPIAAEGFSISQFAAHDHNYWVIAGGSDRGELYGVFRALEQVAQQKFIAPGTESPSSPIRWVNQWDNFDGSIERGYAGRSIFFDNGHVRPDLSRVSEYGRLLASVGLNGATVNNVNSNLHTLDPEMIRELARIADAFRPWGVRMSLSIDLSSPQVVGHLRTFDPLDPRSPPGGGGRSTRSTAPSPTLPAL